METDSTVHSLSMRFVRTWVDKTRSSRSGSRGEPYASSAGASGEGAKISISLHVCGLYWPAFWKKFESGSHHGNGFGCVWGDPTKNKSLSFIFLCTSKLPIAPLHGVDTGMRGFTVLLDSSFGVMLVWTTTDLWHDFNDKKPDLSLISGYVFFSWKTGTIVEFVV